ncbi:hypothetical protein DV515_00002240, partial [Chloebia gouldiae]
MARSKGRHDQMSTDHNDDWKLAKSQDCIGFQLSMLRSQKILFISGRTIWRYCSCAQTLPLPYIKCGRSPSLCNTTNYRLQSRSCGEGTEGHLGLRVQRSRLPEENCLFGILFLAGRCGGNGKYCEKYWILHICELSQPSSRPLMEGQEIPSPIMITCHQQGDNSRLSETLLLLARGWLISAAKAESLEGYPSQLKLDGYDAEQQPVAHISFTLKVTGKYQRAKIWRKQLQNPRISLWANSSE